MFLAAAVACSGGCATIVTGAGKEQQVRVTSQPREAAVFVDDQPVGRTPVNLRLARRQSHRVRIESPGYRPYERTLASGFNAWVFGNVLFGGISGFVIDTVFGARTSLHPSGIDATLVTTGGKPAPADPPTTREIMRGIDVESAPPPGLLPPPD